MADLKISQLPITNTSSVNDVIAIVNDNTTKQISKNDFLINTPTFSGNTDELIGSTMRTIYTRTNVIEYEQTTDTDLFSGSTNFGSRNFPQSFFTNSNDYNNKTIHFRVTGQWASGGGDDTNLTITLQFGDDVFKTDTVTLTQSSNKPSEIVGEIIITQGFALPCYSIGWCDQTGDYRKLAISDPSNSVYVGDYLGGDLKLIINTTTDRNFTSYTGYIQIWN